jgi:membrane-associated phospholipid phosphatase
LSFRESEIDNQLGGFRPIDIATICYLILEIAMIFLFMTHWKGWFYFLGFYIVAIGMVLMFTSFPMPGSPAWWKVLRIIYPAILVTILYEALRSQIFIFHRIPFDAQVYGFEKAVFGRDIYFDLQRYMSVGLNELLSLFYMSYYLLLPGAIILLTLRKQWASLEKMILASCAAFYICFILFIIYPVIGPRYFLDGEFYLPMIGPFFTPLARLIVAGGGLRGGAMPSSHCAIAIIAVVFIIKEFRIRAFPMWIVLVLLCFGTVYGRYHYATDVIVGLAIGVASIILTSRWQNRFLKRKLELIKSPDLECEEPIRTGTNN